MSDFRSENWIELCSLVREKWNFSFPSYNLEREKKKKVPNSKKRFIHKKRKKRKENEKLLPINWTHEKTSKEKASTFLILGKLKRIVAYLFWFFWAERMWWEKFLEGKKKIVQHHLRFALEKRKGKEKKMIFFASKLRSIKWLWEERERKEHKKIV